MVLGPADGIRAGAYIRGRATGTRELDALNPNHLVPQIHAILLTGGSVAPKFVREVVDTLLGGIGTRRDSR